MISRCGQPKSIQGEVPPTRTETKSKQPLIVPQPLNAPTPRDQEIAKQMKAVAQQLTDSKGFYDKLTEAVCSSERYSAPSNAACWDGQKVVTS